MKKLLNIRINNFKNNKKIKSTILIVLTILLCGCSKITGTYFNDENGNYYLKLYNEGDCDFLWGDAWTQKSDEGTCEYDYNDDEFIITFKRPGKNNYDNVVCTYEKNVIDCGLIYGVFKK